MRFAVLQFPGSNCDQDCVHVLGNVLGQQADYLWHKEESLGNTDAVVVPGGFSYGDYLRTGSIAQFSPVMNAVKRFANDGGLVIGICNGFQILCETGLLPGALVRNRSLQFRCEQVYLKVPTQDSPFTREIEAGSVIRVPIAHGEGCYFADDESLARLQRPDFIPVRDSQRRAYGGSQPQRVPAQHRRDLQRSPKRLRHDAPPGTGQRKHPRRGRWLENFRGNVGPF